MILDDILIILQEGKASLIFGLLLISAGYFNLLSLRLKFSIKRTLRGFTDADIIWISLAFAGFGILTGLFIYFPFALQFSWTMVIEVLETMGILLILPFIIFCKKFYSWRPSTISKVLWLGFWGSVSASMISLVLGFLLNSAPLILLYVYLTFFIMAAAVVFVNYTVARAIFIIPKK